MITCRRCTHDKPLTDFAPHALKSKLCKLCSREQLEIRRGKFNPAKRMLFNLKQARRLQGKCDGALWRIEHVQTLLETFEPPVCVQEGEKQGLHPKYRIVCIDPNKPLLPDNAKVKVF